MYKRQTRWWLLLRASVCAIWRNSVEVSVADAGLVLRVPPHSIEAEQSVIGALLSDNSAMDAAEAVLRREDFYAQDHACIYGAVLDLVRTGKPADVVTVFERLQGSKGGVGAAVELAYLNDLSLIHISEPTRRLMASRMPSSA